MSIGIIHELETVEIDKQDTYQPATAFRLAERMFEPVLEQTTVWQVGKMIVQRLNYQANGLAQETRISACRNKAHATSAAVDGPDGHLPRP